MTQQSWLSRRYTGVVNSNFWLGFGILLVLALVAGGVYLFIAPKPELSASSEVGPQVVAPLPSATVTAPVAPPLCQPQPAVAVAPETVVLTTVTSVWAPVGTMSKPGSATGGPLLATRYASCFLRNPEGALYAAASFVAEASGAVMNADRLALVEARAARQGNYDKLVSALSQDGQTIGQPLSRISGYRWVEYSPDAAAVELQFRLIDSPDGEPESTATLFQVVWQDNDWKVVIPGENSGIHQAGSKLRTFTPWGP